MKRFIKSILEQFKPSLKISYYRITVEFIDKENCTEAFLQVADTLAMEPQQKLLHLISGKYAEGFEVVSPSGMNKFDKKGLKIITRALNHIEGIKVHVITGVLPSGL